MRIPTIVAGTAALALLAGCGDSGGTTGTPTTATTPTSNSSGGGDTTANGAPKVKNPLDVKAFEANPCGMATPAQVEAFGLPGVTGRVNSGAPGASCIWLGASAPSKITPSATLIPGGKGLDAMYQNKDSYAAFEVLPAIQGYPAIMNLQVDQRADGNCDVSVGLSDEVALLVLIVTEKGSPRFADPCGAATEFANQVITTIKAGAK
ncbi:uncharacterized protein DUF3558 [Lentzea atacamensis]|uniref:Uncharacterized protein DUF3558 n=2 Tax=Lentzea TaxID=165301 RepID=A0A316HMA6_9PSEU|nr:DUF3558 domain-containing protein [Lentzea atacamensis]PWK82345.1 uncharacterized protein DUF3558 [Lentzea atacamensis]